MAAVTEDDQVSIQLETRDAVLRVNGLALSRWTHDNERELPRQVLLAERIRSV